MTLTSSDERLVVGSSSGDIVVVCCVTGDVVSAIRRAHSAPVTAVVVNSATSVLASGTSISSLIQSRVDLGIFEGTGA